MSMVWPMRMQAGAKLVLLALADNANDSGQCWPGIATLIEKTCLSERAIQRHIRDLAVEGYLTIHERSGRSSVYTLTPAKSAPPPNLPPADLAPTPAKSAPQPPQIWHPEPSDEPSRTGESARKRASRLPDDFELTTERRSYATEQGCNADRTFADFCDHWRAASGERARKVDWDAAWRLWCRREPSFSRSVQHGAKTEPSGELSALKARARVVGFRDIHAGESVAVYRERVIEAESKSRRNGGPQRFGAVQ
jgi:hypothetical protein